MIRANNIHKCYNDSHILKGIDFSVEKSEIVSIVGASGAGKTTLLQILGTLDKADLKKDTFLFINDIEIYKLGDRELSKFRNEHIGFIFQFHQLLPEFTALENICMPAFIKGESKKKAAEKASELMSFLGIENKKNKKPSQLSGGEQQRVAVGRALINNPLVVFADEPSGNLDSKTARELHNLFFELREKYNQTFVIVTHNQEFADMADKTFEMKDGFIV
ncbi:ABC transporter ATP-binding protein [Ichthyobacterium seriolicida]|uniref:Lipoprotein-releasing system ATP-binding protein lolD n=1 Tax=Ichthyobacterium seriolicida TaxID=242600 RepID=A0A1J1E7V8_9FLAO|nr:ABC transporter ATP-binding protein [Ichthyobacterium seriolicida]BAV95422.1 lipoprotein-releasing system ATP-binding protein lolD [Ichthyobacterium seriolicida]